MDSGRERCLAWHSEPTVRVADETIDSIESFHSKKMGSSDIINHIGWSDISVFWIRYIFV